VALQRHADRRLAAHSIGSDLVRAVAGEPHRLADRPLGAGGRAGWCRRPRCTCSRPWLARRDRHAGSGVQPHDRAIEGTANSTGHRKQSDERSPSVHRGRFVGCFGRRVVDRCERHDPAGKPFGRRAAAIYRGGAGRLPARRCRSRACGAARPGGSPWGCIGASGDPARRRDANARRADRGRSGWSEGLRPDLRRYLGATRRSAPGGVGGCRSAHCARDQESVDADPAVGRAPAAQICAPDRRRSRDLCQPDRHDRPAGRRSAPHGR